jgi:SAM-dependent methyltransferase
MKTGADTSWDHVASWYDSLVGEERSDHFEKVIGPGTLRLLRPDSVRRVLDIACGPGSLGRQLAAMGIEAVGVDASPRLIEAARKRSQGGTDRQEPRPAARYEVGDARELTALRETLEAGAGPFDAATCVMALMNIDPLEPVFRGAAGLLREGGALVAVILHPAFRAPGQTSWGWDGDARTMGRSKFDPRARAGHEARSPLRDTPRTGAPGRLRQYRRVDGYLSAGQSPITMNPGKVAHGAAPVTTWTFHRPIQAYVKALADAGFVIESLEEWPSMRQSEPHGARASEENRARREIPMFLGVRAVKRPSVSCNPPSTSAGNT